MNTSSWPSNRTKVELKPVNNLQYKINDLLLIVPKWN